MSAMQSVTPITTVVMASDPARYDMAGQRLTDTLHAVDETITQGLAKRLLRYARQEMDAAGFASMVEDWTVEVYTIDGDDRPADRSYCVRWKNAKGGYIEVIGILTNKGWPSVNHGFAIGEE
ncbi:hypothetical protein [Burkholderia ambifaria]|uniref:hypothetical protein n=1 Tax=Burkholderia ambifaria TaxID=152480 RepID=UPI000F7FD6F5|nr:hypothetical protein [Burkholderia ambifaria]